MKRILLLLAAWTLAATTLPAQSDLIARIHFAGAEWIAADANHTAFTNEFCSAEARALEAQTLDKMSRAPAEWFKSKLPPGAGDGTAQLRPLLDDLLKSEWTFEIRDSPRQSAAEAGAPGSPEYALAIRLSPERAQLWQNNLQALLEAWTKLPARKSQNGWELKKDVAPNLIQLSRSGDWVIVDCAQNKVSLSGEIVKSVAAGTNWLTADLNWPRLAQLFPALAKFDFPKIALQVVGREGNLRLSGRLNLAGALPALVKWRIPVDTIQQPLVSFTAVRGVGPWLARQSWAQPYELPPPPDQFFIWAQPGMPFQTYAAMPVPDAAGALAQIHTKLSEAFATRLKGYFWGDVAPELGSNEISWRGLPPLITPSVEARREAAGDFLVGGFFPIPQRTRPLQPELLNELDKTNLVYYHWEITSERLKALPQLSQLLLMITQHKQLAGDSAAEKWLNRIGPEAGPSVTEATQTGPDQLAFIRTSSVGLTAVELVALANWLEATNFPGCDLRQPPPHRIRRPPPHATNASPAAPAKPQMETTNHAK